MFIESIKYAQWQDTENEWSINGCTLRQINLIVGKNSSGKTKTLNVIGNLGRLISGEVKPFSSANYEQVKFKKGKRSYTYSLQCEESKVVSERVKIGSKVMMVREKGGSGKIRFEEEDRKIRFQTPDTEVGIFARRDAIQHPFLEEFFEWGNSIRHYYFGKDLGQTSFAVFQKSEDDNIKKIANPKDTQQIVPIVKQGLDDFSGIYEKRIIKDMAEIGYDISGIEVVPQRKISVAGNPPLSTGEVSGIRITEKDLQCGIDQLEISQGMFRAMSLIAQIAYSELLGNPLCILIDDIGEGLDFERSTALIKLLIRRAKQTSTQLIMTTNDRFVMNNVPLDYWSIADRIGNKVHFLNQNNAKEIFESFALTGLNNFDLFSSGYFLEGK